ncbi:MAG TPA: hypothetical protein VLF93_04620 [Candidatus Saccharimonadales bacterium]|nr:hypothetical protein [Candidatus Saccharimonadales bacterium]
MIPPLNATGDALSDAIGGLFDIPEADLDNQFAEMAGGSEASYTSENSDPSGSNATENDGGLDAALIDLIPFP